jgi:hypothetical protein
LVGSSKRQAHPQPLTNIARARRSGLSLQSAADSEAAQSNSEHAAPLFNFCSMAEGIGIDLDTGGISGKPAHALFDESRVRVTRRDQDKGGDLSVSRAALKPSDGQRPVPADTATFLSSNSP